MNLVDSSSSEQPQTQLNIRHGFEISGHRFMIQRGTYSELTNRTAICPIPDTRSHFLGFINQRGETVPVFDLQRIVDPTSDASGRWVLLIDQAPNTIGLILDSYPKGLNNAHPAANSAADQEDSFSEFSGSAYECDNQTWYEFNHTRFCEFIKRSVAV